MAHTENLNTQYEDETLDQLMRWDDTDSELTNGDGISISRLNSVTVPRADHSDTADVATRAFTADRTTQSTFNGTHTGDGSGLLDVPLSTSNQNLITSYGTRIDALETSSTTPALPDNNTGLTAGQLYTQTGTQLGLAGAAASLKFVIQV